jgi:hypothetical protein
MIMITILNILSVIGWVAFMFCMYYITKPDREEKDIDWVFRKK